MFQVQQVIFQKAIIRAKCFYKNFQLTKNLETKSSTTFYSAYLIECKSKLLLKNIWFFDHCVKLYFI